MEMFVVVVVVVVVFGLVVVVACMEVHEHRMRGCISIGCCTLSCIASFLLFISSSMFKASISNQLACWHHLLEPYQTSGLVKPKVQFLHQLLKTKQNAKMRSDR